MNIKPITIKPLTVNPGGAKGMSLSDAGSEATIRMTPVPAAARPAPAAPVPPSAAPAAAAPAAPAAPAAAPAPAAPAATAPAAPAAAPAPAAPKGIRPISIKPPVPVAPPDVTAQAIKGKTSRISLDAALASPAGAAPAMGRITANLSGAADAAKSGTGKIPSGAEPDSQATIRLQKPPAAAASGGASAPAAAPAAPSEAPTVKRKPLSLKTAGAAPGAGEDSKPTLRLKTPGASAGAAKKPVVKTPGAPAAEGEDEAPAKTGTAMGADIEAPPSAFGNAQLAPARNEKVNVFFPIAAAAAVVMLALLSMLLMSQACGPNEGSLTQLSTFQGFPSIQLLPRYVSR